MTNHLLFRLVSDDTQELFVSLFGLIASEAA
jgi:hypothetical protein